MATDQLERDPPAMGLETIFDAEASADDLLRSIGAHAAELSVVELCVAVTGAEPLIVGHLRCNAHLGADGLVRVRASASPERQAFDACHELMHRYRRDRGLATDEETEEWCNVGAASILMPRTEVRAAIKELGAHSYTKLAVRFGVPQSVAFLRIAEVTGRPGCLYRETGEPIFRGRDFAWPSLSTIVRALRGGFSEVHPVWISDEPGKRGLMATREAWASMAA